MQNYCRQHTMHIDIYFTRSFILYQLNDVTRMKKCEDIRNLIALEKELII